MLVSRLLVRGRIHRQHSALWSKRYISRKNGTQRRGLADEQPVLPLDAVIKRLTPATAVSWPALPERKDAQVLVREIRACIVANNIVAAMAILRDVPQPYPRLVAHAAVHALLRVGDPHRAGAFLLSFAIGPKTTKARPPRIHPTTLSETVKALITLVPATQGRQDRVRTAQGPQLLVLDAYMVSDPALRTALALYLQARKLFVPRSKSITGPIWNALLNHREWIPAALMLDLQVKDFQLRKTIPTLLHTPDPAAPRLTPHDRDHLGRRLDILRREDMRVNHTFFTDLCFRISGVISSLLSRPESGLMSPALIEVLKKPNTSKRFPDNDRENGRFVRSGGPPAKTPLTPTRAKHHVRVALQALAFLGALVDSRSLPFGDISAWIRTVGSLPPALDAYHVYTMVKGRPKLVAARAHLHTVLEAYAFALPRAPHIYSQFPFGSGGFIRRGLKHKRPIAGSPLQTSGAESAVDVPQFTAAAVPKVRFSPPEDPVEAADDSFMAPPLMPTYEALLGVFLNGGNAGRGGVGPGVLYLRSTAEQAARWNRVAAKEEAVLKEMSGFKTPPDCGAATEARIHQHYHAPRSPNNPHPHVFYPEHPLDFDKYPALRGPPVVPPPSPGSSLGSASVEQHRLQLTTRVLMHMLHERSPPLPPWESPTMMRLLGRRTDLLQPTLEESGLWEEVWDGAARYQREAEVHAFEARRLVAEESVPWDQHIDDKEEWAVEDKETVLQGDSSESEDKELDTFNQRLAKRARDTDFEMYYSNIW